MNAQRIREQLKQHGYNYTRISNVLGVSPSYVSMVAARARTCPRVAVAIATALEIPVDRVFPDVAEYRVPLMTPAEREAALEDKLRKLGALRRSA